MKNPGRRDGIMQLENERKRVAERSNKVVPAVPTMPAVLAGTQRKGG